MPQVLVSWSYLAVFLASVGLCVFVASLRSGACRYDGLRLRAFLASGLVVALARRHFNDNELAGVLGLYLPLTVALAMSPAFDRARRAVWRLQIVLLTLVFGSLLVGTGSRGGLVAAALSVGAVLASSGRRGRTLLGAGLLAAAAGVAVIGFETTSDCLVYGGSVQGFSAAVVLTGRPAIWRRAGHALADFPLAGLGPGAFGNVVNALYPSIEPRTIEDAHNLFLQTALDGGPAALLALIFFVLVLGRRLLAGLRASAPRSLARARGVGLLAALAGHLVYSLGDSVSLGSPGGAAWWFFCGLVLASTPRLGWGSRRAWAAAGTVTVLLGTALCVPGLEARLATLEAARALVASNDRAAASAWERLESTETCRGRWFQGLVAEQLRRPGLRDAAFAELIRCSADHFELLQAVVGGNRELAELAALTWSDHAEAHFWLARALRASGTRQAIATYRRGLELDPSRAGAWLELARLLVPDDPRAALEAFVEACRRGDPGANGCVGAGRVAEELGDLDAAVGWYRASRWGPSRARADELTVAP